MPKLQSLITSWSVNDYIKFRGNFFLQKNMIARTVFLPSDDGTTLQVSCWLGSVKIISDAPNFPDKNQNIFNSNLQKKNANNCKFLQISFI